MLLIMLTIMVAVSLLFHRMDIRINCRSDPLGRPWSANRQGLASILCRYRLDPTNRTLHLLGESSHALGRFCLCGPAVPDRPSCHTCFIAINIFFAGSFCSQPGPPGRLPPAPELRNGQVKS